MRCRHARRAIHEALNERTNLTVEVEAHLAGCAECRAEHQRLAALATLVGLAVGRAADGLSGVPQGAARSAAATMRRRLAPVGRPALALHLGWAVVAACMFLVGLSIRRVETVQKTVVQEKLVEVPVTVVQERVVYRSAPPAATVQPALRTTGAGASGRRLVTRRRGRPTTASRQAVPTPAPWPAPALPSGEQLPPAPPPGTVVYTELVEVAKLAGEQTGG